MKQQKQKKKKKIYIQGLDFSIDLASKRKNYCDWIYIFCSVRFGFFVKWYLFDELSCEFARRIAGRRIEAQRDTPKSRRQTINCHVHTILRPTYELIVNVQRERDKRIGDSKQLQIRRRQQHLIFFILFKEYKCDLNKQANIIQDYGRWIIHYMFLSLFDGIERSIRIFLDRIDFLWFSTQIITLIGLQICACSRLFGWHCAPCAQTMTTEMPLFMLRDRGNNQKN